MALPLTFLYPPATQPGGFSFNARSVKIARHTECSKCSCWGWHPPEGYAVVINNGSAEAQTALDEAKESTEVTEEGYWRVCACGDGIEDHGNGADIPEDELERRARVAIRIDQILEDKGLLSDFIAPLSDVLSLRKQMVHFGETQSRVLEEISPPPASKCSPTSSALSDPPEKLRKALVLVGDSSDEDDAPLTATSRATAPTHPSGDARAHSSSDSEFEIEIEMNLDLEPKPSGMSAAKITHEMPIAEIFKHLQHHGCNDVSGQLDESTFTEHPVSNGGFGDIYRGALRDGQRVSIKCLRLYMDSTNTTKKQLKRAAHEIYVWSKCNHPNVMGLIGVALHRNQIAMISPWMENGNLRRLLSRQPMPEVDRYSLCVQIADGVAYLHSEGIIHGDIKGDNILLSQDLTPKLADFGNAALREYTLQFTKTMSKASLSLNWAPPEMIIEDIRPNAKTDVFSLGMTILEVITGLIPYDGMGQFAVMNKITKNEYPPRPEEHIPSQNEQANRLWSLLTSCWTLSPRNRPSATEVRDKMREISWGRSLGLSRQSDGPESPRNDSRSVDPRPRPPSPDFSDRPGSAGGLPPVPAPAPSRSSPPPRNLGRARTPFSSSTQPTDPPAGYRSKDRPEPPNTRYSPYNPQPIGDPSWSTSRDRNPTGRLSDSKPKLQDPLKPDAARSRDTPDPQPRDSYPPRSIRDGTPPRPSEDYPSRYSREPTPPRHSDGLGFSRLAMVEGIRPRKRFRPNDRVRFVSPS